MPLSMKWPLSVRQGHQDRHLYKRTNDQVDKTCTGSEWKDNMAGLSLSGGLTHELTAVQVRADKPGGKGRGRTELSTEGLQ